MTTAVTNRHFAAMSCSRVHNVKHPNAVATSFQLKRESEQSLIAQPWSQRPFVSTMTVPIYDFMTGEFTKKIFRLDPEVFNQPLRRDIIKNVYEYWRMKDRYVLKKTKSFGEVAGSGKKPTPQKGRGAARQGNKRAPQRAGGGVAHGVVPRCLGFPINAKLRLLAIKTMLSARLYEDRIIFIDSEKLDHPKTQMLKAIIEPFGMDKLCLLAPQDICPNFEKASRNISNLKVVQPQTANLPDLLLSDYIIMTKQGLKQFEHVLKQRQLNYFRNRKVSNQSQIRAWQKKNSNPFLRDIVKPIINQKQIEGYDDEMPLTLLTPSLRQYIQDLRDIKQGKIDEQERKAAEEEQMKKMEEAEQQAAKAQKDRIEKRQARERIIRKRKQRIERWMAWKQRKDALKAGAAEEGQAAAEVVPDAVSTDEADKQSSQN